MENVQIIYVDTLFSRRQIEKWRILTNASLPPVAKVSVTSDVMSIVSSLDLCDEEGTSPLRFFSSRLISANYEQNKLSDILPNLRKVFPQTVDFTQKENSEKLSKTEAAKEIKQNIMWHRIQNPQNKQMVLVVVVRSDLIKHK